jgi:hypothetical protein
VRQAIHLQFDISANVSGIKAGLIPKCIIWCALDCTHVHVANGLKVFFLYCYHNYWPWLTGKGCCCSNFFFEKLYWPRTSSLSRVFIHYQPINVPTAGAQAFLMHYPQGGLTITHHPGPVRI